MGAASRLRRGTNPAAAAAANAAAAAGAPENTAAARHGREVAAALAHDTLFFVALLAATVCLSLHWSGFAAALLGGEDAPLPWVELLCALQCALFGVTLTSVPVAVAVVGSACPPLLPRHLVELCATWCGWNSYLICWAMFTLPFLATPGISYTRVVACYYAWVTFVPSPPVILTGSAKVLSRLLGYEWGTPQLALVGATCAVLSVAHFALFYETGSDEFYTAFTCTGLYYVYCVHTFWNCPEVNGRRRSKRVARESSAWRNFFHSLIGYLDLNVVFDGHVEGAGSPLVANKPYIMGFHPHGIVPYSAGLATVHPTWQRVTGGVWPHYMVDSLLMTIPVVRDIMQWMGSKEVSKPAIIHSLHGGNGVILVPGGQVEMHRSRSWSNQIVVYRGHKGFVRMAMQHGADLVPCVSIGECALMDNVYFPPTQDVSYRLLGFPIPFIPHGRYYLPIPRRTPHGVTIVVGQPLVVGEAVADPSEAAVGEMHRRYYDQVKEQFDRHKAAAGYPELELVWEDKPGAPAQGKKAD